MMLKYGQIVSKNMNAGYQLFCSAPLPLVAWHALLGLQSSGWFMILNQSVEVWQIHWLVYDMNSPSLPKMRYAKYISKEQTANENVSMNLNNVVSNHLGTNSSFTLPWPVEKKANAFSTPSSIELCGSRWTSQYLWWHLCWLAHQIGPPWWAAHYVHIIMWTLSEISFEHIIIISQEHNIHIPALPNTCKIRRIPGPHLNAPCAAYRCKQTDMQIPPLQIAKKTDNTIGLGLPLVQPFL